MKIMERKMSCSAALLLLLIILTFQIGAGCTPDTSKKSTPYLSAGSVQTDNEYTRVIVRNGIQFKLKRMSSQYLLGNDYDRLKELQEKLRRDEKTESSVRDSILKSALRDIERKKSVYDRSIYLSLQIGGLDELRDIEYERMAQDQDRYSEWLEKLLFNMEKFVYIESPSAGEVPLSLYNMERTYGMSTDKTFLLIYPKEFNGHPLSDGTPDRLSLRIKEFGLRTGDVTIDL